MTPVSVFISQFNLLKNDLNTLHNEVVDLNKYTLTTTNLIISDINIIIDKLNILKSKITSSPPGNNIHNNIDREMLLSISNGIGEILEIIDDRDFLDRGKLPSIHFTEFQAMIDSLGEQLFFSK
ncbi:hypothetical protein [uncultured Flavobacterium sp.]|uniref:hypothetical protein n=1 Tax=uncultured Flavobacterium sp. TaxID=165435 RepID=UPI0026120F7D|nr:hypothetical protein [uncultured Flavobacterium sp.]